MQRKRLKKYLMRSASSFRHSVRDAFSVALNPRVVQPEGWSEHRVAAIHSYGFGCGWDIVDQQLAAGRIHAGRVYQYGLAAIHLDHLFGDRRCYWCV